MTNRVQTLRSNIAGNRPTGRLPGELYVNLADAQLGVINASSTAQDLLPVRIFQVSANYNIGDHVLQGGFLWRAIATVAAGSFNSTQWQQITPNALPLSGGTMTGPLILNADPPFGANLQAATKHYVDSAVAGGVVVNPNRLINGDMRIDQRNNGSSGTVQNVYTVDRWVYNGSQASKGTWGRGGNGQNGLPYYLGFTSSSAYASVAADFFAFSQSIEADMVSDFQWGAAAAQQVTLSFWALSSKTGTFSGSIQNYASTRSYPFTYSLPAASVWTKIAVTIPGDTGGTWVMSGNAGSIVVWFDFGCGTTFRGPSGAWVNGNYFGATGSVSVVATNGATFYLTGVKLELGSIATPFPQQSLAKSMADCQRYYWSSITQVPFYSFGPTAGPWSAGTLIFPTMRSAPAAAAVSPSYNGASGVGLTTSINMVDVELSKTSSTWAMASFILTLSAEL